MAVGAEVRSLWARTRILVWPERYVLASLPPGTVDAIPLPRGFFAVVAEKDEVSVLMEAGAWDGSALRPKARAVAQPFRVVTLDLVVDLATSGYFAPAAARLAEAGVSIVPVCAHGKDHLAVHERDLGACVDVLERLVRESA